MSSPIQTSWSQFRPDLGWSKLRLVVVPIEEEAGKISYHISFVLQVDGFSAGRIHTPSHKMEAFTSLQLSAVRRHVQVQPLYLLGER